jgi:phosphomevalonate kinase
MYVKITALTVNTLVFSLWLSSFSCVAVSFSKTGREQPDAITAGQDTSIALHASSASSFHPSSTDSSSSGFSADDEIIRSSTMVDSMSASLLHSQARASSDDFSNGSQLSHSSEDDYFNDESILASSMQEMMYGTLSAEQLGGDPPTHTVVASAAGKVLITGGYLILDQANSGLVLALNARFHVRVSAIAEQDRLWVRETLSKCGFTPQPRVRIPIVVQTPQRCTKPSVYVLSMRRDTIRQPEHGHFKFVQYTDNENNKFVEYATRYALWLIAGMVDSQTFHTCVKHGLVINLKGDPQFYSTRAEEPDAKAEDMSKDSKTGLGSSAALVSSLVAALFAYFGLLESSADADVSVGDSNTPPSPTAVANNSVLLHAAQRTRARRIAHNVAQFAHCAAQGKVGSGFDISAAFFGSQKYTRFSPKCIDPLLKMDEKDQVTQHTLVLYTMPFRPADSADHMHAWDYLVEPFQLPPGMVLMLGDVQGGSETPGMVKKVLKWRKTKPEEASRVWSDLNAANSRVEELIRQLGQLAKSDTTAYRTAIALLGSKPHPDWSLVGGEASQLVLDIRDTFLQVRQLLREMGSCSGVPIEPEQQTHLLDYTMDQPGVLMAGVPGAGGFDAIFAVALNPDAAASLEQAWVSYPRFQVTKLPVDREDDGVQIQVLPDKSVPAQF